MAAKSIIEEVDEPLVRFQAVLLLRDCLLGDWNSIPADQVDLLRTELLEFTIGKW